MSPFVTRFLGAFRLTLSVLLGIGISLALGWPKPEWSAIASVVMNLPFLGATIERGLTRLLGTLAGAFIGLWLVTAFGEHQFLFLVFVFFFGSWCLYMGQGSLYPYSFMLGAVTALIVALPAINAGQTAPQEVWQNALYRTLETMLGITVSTVVQSVLWPNYAGPKLRTLMDGILNVSQKLIATCVQDQLAARHSDPVLAQEAREATGLLVGSDPLFSFAQRDTRSVNRRRLAYATALDNLHALLASVSELHLGHDPPPPGPGTANLAPALTRLAQMVQTELTILRNAWISGEYRLPPPTDFSEADTAFLADFERARHAEHVVAGEMIRLMGVRTALGDIWQALGALRISLAAANGPLYLQDNLPERIEPPPASPTAASYRFHLAIKAGLAVTIGSYLYLFVNIPGALALPVAALFFVVITVLSRYQPSLILNLGMILGSIMAGFELYWVFPHLGSFVSLSFALLPGLLFWGWVSGNPRYAGVGMLGCILYIYSFDLTEQQTYSLSAYVGFVVGQVLGTSLATACLIVPWPLYPQREVRLHLARFWECAHDLIQAYSLDFPWSEEHTEEVRILEHSLLVLPSKAAAWVGDLRPRRFPPLFCARLAAHLAAAQSLGMQIRALSLARQKIHAFPLYQEIIPYLRGIRVAAITDLAAFQLAFLENTPPPPPTDILDQCRALNDRFEQLRAAGRTFVFSPAELGAVLAIIARYHDLARNLLAAREALLDSDYALLGREWFL
jgi:uncharacterized membrane protein YccC